MAGGSEFLFPRREVSLSLRFSSFTKKCPGEISSYLLFLGFLGLRIICGLIPHCHPSFEISSDIIFSPLSPFLS